MKLPKGCDVYSAIVPIRPVPKPRMTRKDKWSKRPVVVNYYKFADALKEHVGETVIRSLNSSLVCELQVVARFAPAKSLSQKARIELVGDGNNFHRQRPDCSNILKGVEDILFEHDEEIPDVRCRKYWADQDSIEIVISYMPFDDKSGE